MSTEYPPLGHKILQPYLHDNNSARIKLTGVPSARPAIGEDRVHEIPMNEVSPDFSDCWKAASRLLQQQGQGAINELRAHLHPPVLEQLSLRPGIDKYHAYLAYA